MNENNSNELQLLIEGALAEFKSLGDYLHTNESKPQQIGAGLAQKIAANDDLIHTDVKDELVDMQMTFMDNEMVRSNVQLFATRLASIFDVATAMKVKLVLSAEDDMLLNNIREATKPFFTIKGGVLSPIDKAEYDLIRQNFLNKATDDSTMRANFKAVKDNIKKM